MPSCTRQLLLTAAALRPVAAPITLARRAYREQIATTTFVRPQRRSKRREKHRRTSPSKVIISALEDHGLRQNTPSVASPRKVDLSHVHWKAELDDWARQTKTFQRKRRGDNGYADDSGRLTLQDIVASEIRKRFAEPSTHGVDTGPAAIKEQELKLELLASRGYTTRDVDDWVSILTDQNTEAAAQALLEHDVSTVDAQPQLKRPLPAFVFLFLLRKSGQSFSSKAFRFCLTHAWNELYRKRIAELSASDDAADGQNPKAYHLGYPTMSDSSVMIMVVRLLRLARNVAPESLITVASMFTHTFRLPSSPDGSHIATIPPKRPKTPNLDRLNAQYNRVLSLISLPASETPFLATRYSQRAQFDVLRSMAEHSPPLTITREGYRAVMQVHLAARKTETEQDWDALKAKSWPPWKEDRTGLDAYKGPEYGISTALRAMRHATNAGYALGPWERVAHILSGWDLDGSPVIQTRALLLHNHVTQRQLLQEYKVADGSTDNSTAAWAARIKATRTVQEAWACFLMHKELALKQPGVAKLSESIYHAMFEKLSAGTIGATNDEQDEQEPSLAPLRGGDAKEVWPIPESPKEATYVRLEPPTLDELANEMHTADIVPGARTTALLVSRAHSLGQGAKYLKWAASRDPRLLSLFSPTPEQEKELKDIPKTIVTAYLKLLCLFSTSRLDEHLIGSDKGTYPRSQTALEFAQRLLQAYGSGSRVPYHVVLRRLAFNKRPSGSYIARLAMSKTAIERYFVMQQIIDHMPSVGIVMDSGTFRIQCSGLESAIFASLDVLENPYVLDHPNITTLITSYRPVHDEQEHMQTSDIRSVADEIIRTGAAKIRALFNELMDDAAAVTQPSNSSKQPHGSMELPRPESDLPRLFNAPEPIVLHYYIRVLGLLRDYQGLAALLEWMGTYKDEIEAAAAGPRGGRLLLRRCFVALRVFIERAWIERPNGDDEDATPHKAGGKPPSLAAPKQTRLRIKALVEELGWGQWPDDNEVEAYVQGGEFPNARG